MEHSAGHVLRGLPSVLDDLARRCIIFDQDEGRWSDGDLLAAEHICRAGIFPACVHVHRQSNPSGIIEVALTHQPLLAALGALLGGRTPAMFRCRAPSDPDTSARLCIP